jgi:hypothetical protein
MMPEDGKRGPIVDPSKLLVTEKRAQHLAKLANLNVKQFAGKTIAQANKLLE